jgi:hypothetical protein
MPIKLNGATSGSVELDVPAAVSGGDVTLTLPPDDGSAGQVLSTNGAGALSFVNAIAEVDLWRLTQDKTGDNTVVSGNLARQNDPGFGYIGTGMTEASGIFTFPRTGFYLVVLCAQFVLESNDNAEVGIDVTINNADYNRHANAFDGNPSGDERTGSATAFTLVDVTDTANVKLRFICGSFNSSSRLLGDSTKSETHMLFARIGDT